MNRFLLFTGGYVLGKFMALNTGERIWFKREFTFLGGTSTYELGIPWGFTCFDRKVTKNPDGTESVEISWDIKM